MYDYLFDDKFWMWLWHNFSISMVMIPAIFGALLKLVAKIHPEVPTDEIMDLIKVVFAKPGSNLTSPSGTDAG